MRFSHYVTLNQPGRPITYWNRKIKGWVPYKSLNCEYSSLFGAKIGAGKKKSDYALSELKDYISFDFLSTEG